ncbi:MAG: elongation factor Tu [Kiritimatiellae bacterium]|jgi:translation elongation factor EF-Tu-like GTPase|nr:elongation factor Tu [Kiritimatiellia bacterium]
MNDRFSKDAEGIVTYLPENAGGRKMPVFQEYRPQFYYEGHDWDAVQHYPDVEKVDPGETVRVIFSFLSPDEHWGKLQEGTLFLIREGTRTVGYGKITQILNLEKSAQRSREQT